MELIFPSVIVILGCVALLLLLQWKNLRGPPCIRGWIPWIGAAFDFGKAPLEFIEKARFKYGPIFTVFAMGTRMTFVTEEEGINVFLKSKEVDFELAVQTPVYRTASIPKNIFLALHEKLYVLMKGKMGTFNLCQLTEQLTEELHEQLRNLGTCGSRDLNILVRHLLYPVSVNILFKKGLFPTNKRKIMEFHQHFQVYDEGFEHGSQMPECLLRNWSKSKRWLLAFFEKNIPAIKTYKSEKDNSMTLMQALLDVIETETNEQSPNYGLLLLWASLSNAVPVSISVRLCFGHLDLSSLNPVSTRPLWKAYHLCLAYQNYTVPSGDLLMLSPFWLHRDPKYFPEPELFKPERWKEANLEKHAFLDYFMAFGSGKYQCPGRWLALLEIEICIILLFYYYDCSLLDPLPKQRSLHLLGVQQPEGQCRIEYKQRK
ncbi:24-hydroxycholesterol 7-alpha-hydroxylase isoform X3 [Sturnira hondurensis]|uniref:24-hydroxycholesterol 7-alpha-hydroxylase isoform X3 n=1 Tax=Sturnira hondurensis TaxID=192404 RepID=UPI00187A50A5|nr:24-hydroxycholesterol 7-alpha-hydroxylase isoform X3 [Sturnira hondurensis]